MRRKAFSLIEVSIAVFILAMLVAVSVPAFVRTYNDLTLRETARTFSTMCQYARVEAVSRRINSVLHIDLDRQVFWVTQDGATLKTYEVSKRVLIASVQFIDTTGQLDRVADVNFYPNGTCDSATIVFRGAEKSALAATIDPITCKANPYVVKP